MQQRQRHSQQNKCQANPKNNTTNRKVGRNSCEILDRLLLIPPAVLQKQQNKTPLKTALQYSARHTVKSHVTETTTKNAAILVTVLHKIFSLWSEQHFFNPNFDFKYREFPV